MPHLLLQLALILALARAFVLLLGRLGQPPVVGEMIAGIALGPIALGALFPAAHAALFPPGGLAGLESLSQVGLVLFMFIVGAELRVPRERAAAAGLVGTLGVLLPMALGCALAPFLYARFAPAGVAFRPFALFVATALAITAFPVLARLLKDRGLARTPVGQLALAAAAVADVLAWIALAVVVVLIAAQGGWSGLARALGGLAGLAALAFGALRPFVARALARHAVDGRPHGGVLGWLLIGACAMAAASDALGLHAVFGAFLFGLCLPRDDRLLETLVERIEHVAVLALLPVFFALAGLRATPDALTGASGLAMLLVFVVAVAGKLAGAGLAARLAGLGGRDSAALGVLMNARGLMELIVLKVGLDAGVIGPELFTMLLVMAVLTTLMTTPMLALCLPRRTAPAGLPDRA